MRDAAREMRDRLKALGLASFAMATGGKGLHVVVPLTPHHEWQDVKAFAEAMARVMAADDPDRYLAEAGIGVDGRHPTNTDGGLLSFSHTGFGGPQGAFAIEYIIDNIARSLGRDPLDIRLANLYGKT